ncbi:unnamed protein product [Closterium sp. Yama58-4]|nr:unnamed protein product [Closterium sp. Yama58-4]
MRCCRSAMRAAVHVAVCQYVCSSPNACPIPSPSHIFPLPCPFPSDTLTPLPLPQPALPPSHAPLPLMPPFLPCPPSSHAPLPPMPPLLPRPSPSLHCTPARPGQEMERRGPAPDAAVFHVVMEGERHAEAVTALLDAMARCHVPPTERTFSVAMACMGRAGDVAAAEALWHRMTAAHIAPSPFAFCALAHVYGQAGMVERCAGVVQQMETSLAHTRRRQARGTARRVGSAALRDTPDWPASCGAVGAVRGEGGGMGAAEEMGAVGGMAGGVESGGDGGVGRASGEEGMKRRGRGRRLHVAGVGEERDGGGAEGQHSGRMAAARGGTHASNRMLLTSAHNILIGAHAGRGDAEAAVAVLRGMRRKGLQPCMRSFNAAALACMRARRVERAVRLLGEAQRQGLPPTAATFALLIQAGGHMRRAGMVEAALHRMALAGCPHDAVTYRSAVYAWVRCGEGGRALEVLQEMVAAGHPPAMTVPDVLIKVTCSSRCAHQGVLIKVCSSRCAHQGVLIKVCSSRCAHQGVLIKVCSSRCARQGVLIKVCSSRCAHQGVLIKVCLSRCAHQGVLIKVCLTSNLKLEEEWLCVWVQ